MKSRFKKFGGEFIPDIVEYLKKHLFDNERITISVGCDSIQRRRKTVYAITIMMYDSDIRNGAHLVFYRENISKVRNHYERLQKEAELALEVANFLNDELKEFYQRKDLTDLERRRYKFHLGKCQGDYSHVALHGEDSFIRNISLTPSDREIIYKLVDIHVDFNPFEGFVDKKGNAKNKSNMAYKTMVPWMRSLGYRVFAKPLSYAASSAADLLLQD
jgi:predicted RNase H-related nuclease YkuK (DUF458 family)